jgi:hypothetical protein
MTSSSSVSARPGRILDDPRLVLGHPQHGGDHPTRRGTQRQ